MRTWTLWMSGVAVLAVAAGLWAQGRPAYDPLPPVSRAWGTVKSIDLDAKTLVVTGKTKRDEEAKDLTFSLTDATKVMLPGGEGGLKAGTLADVKVDARVTVIYRVKDDAFLAMSIVVSDANAPVR